ncbi:MAG: DNA recombination protein RmuC [Alphaproteobacteria bacterium MarineAlpha11_Bin1]|nr:MAG: DNA recombination protein RmuC [Alphaproteobacteria bacterium MarineAlpha11_Bin1]|tara:strand:- start:3409 stop:4560 length:1152 start_codon:yes stop_codon:yes gene_type:complete
MESVTFIAVVVAIGSLAFVALVLLRGNSRNISEEITRTAERLTTQQIELAGRLSQIAEADAASQKALSERLQNQEIAITKTLEERLADVTKRVGDTLQKTNTKSSETMAKLQERLAVIDAAQKNITDLSAQMVQLQDVLTNRQARGAFGEIQLQDLVRAALPPSAYEFQKTLSNNKRADCVLNLPNPPGAIAIDAKFPLESYHALRAAKDEAGRIKSSRAFATDVLKHVHDIADRYIIPGQTAESALMFLPSEAVYAELYANHPETVEKSYRARVWIVSPTTLMATLNTVRAVLKDASMQEQAGVIQSQVRKLLVDVARIDDRVDKLQVHFRQAQEDISKIRTSTNKVKSRGEKIELIELGELKEGDKITAGAEIHRLEQGNG